MIIFLGSVFPELGLFFYNLNFNFMPSVNINFFEEWNIPRRFNRFYNPLKPFMLDRYSLKTIFFFLYVSRINIRYTWKILLNATKQRNCYLLIITEKFKSFLLIKFTKLNSHSQVHTVKGKTENPY